MISVAAELSGLHPQTLRTYERMGLIMPGRTGGGGRRYCSRDLDLLREIAASPRPASASRAYAGSSTSSTGPPPSAARNAELQAELEGTREALRQAMAVRRAEGVPPSKLPVLRQPAPASRSSSGAAAAELGRRAGQSPEGTVAVMRVPSARRVPAGLGGSPSRRGPWCFSGTETGSPGATMTSSSRTTKRSVPVPSSTFSDSSSAVTVTRTRVPSRVIR